MSESAEKLPNKWVVLMLLLGIAIFNHADRFLLAGLVEPIKRSPGLNTMPWPSARFWP